MKYTCCRHLLGGITFFFDEVRCCCSNNKGITFEENYKGGKIFDVQKMKEYRNQVIENCKKGIIPENCKNCIELCEKEWDEKPLIDEIYLLHWDHCNCGCVYCLQMEHGEFLLTESKKSRYYDVFPILKEIYSQGLVSKDVHFEIVGGDLTILDEADDIINLVIDNGVGRMSFHSSVIGYSKGIERALKECNCDFDFSIDCGSRDLYKKIKRTDSFDKVIENLKRYLSSSPTAKDKLVAKYILIDGLNDNVQEVEKWIDLIHDLGIQKCKIDVNFKKFFPEYQDSEPEVPKHYFDIFDVLNNKASQYNMEVCNWEFTDSIMEEARLNRKKKEESFSLKRRCAVPFERIEINHNGEVYTCCPSWVNHYCIGNIKENTLEEIWNGEKVKKLRESVLDGSYSFCSKEYCHYISGNFETPAIPIEDIKINMDRMPYSVKLSYDKECNIACKICRDDILVNTQEEQNNWDKFFDENIFAALKEAKRVTINAHGDPFGSRHSRATIKKIAEAYPEIRFDFHTNGTLCDEKILDELCVKDRFDAIRISVSATTEETYSKMISKGNNLFNKLLSNLENLSSLKQKRDFEFYLHFIVSGKNYVEIVDFINFAEKYNAIPCFWEFNRYCVAYAHNLDDSWEITKPEHPEYSKLQELLKNPKFEKYKLYISPVLWNIREEALKNSRE